MADLVVKGVPDYPASSSSWYEAAVRTALLPAWRESGEHVSVRARWKEARLDRAAAAGRHTKKKAESAVSF